MVLSSCFNAEVGIPPQPIALIALVYVGCQAKRPTIRRRIKPCCIRARVFEFRPMLASSVISLDQAHLAEVARRGVPVPGYDRDRLAPRLVHIGVGGFHRAHLAVYVQELAADGGGWGIVGLGLLEQDARMARALRAQDHLYTLIAKGAGPPSAAIVGSIIGYVHAPPGHDAAVGELIAAP